MGIPVIVAKIARDLRVGDMNIKPGDMIYSANGLYGLIERGEHLFITQIILHIAEYQVRFLDGPRKSAALCAFHNSDYDAPELRREIHKYHFSYCKPLKDMFERGRRHRYKQSHRQDGKFRYMFIDGGKVTVDRNEQMLYVCQYCLNWLQQKTGLPLEVKTFLPPTFFENIDNLEWLHDCGYETDEDAGYVGYSDDFKKISKRVRERRDYRCEICKINLSEDSLQKFLDCHHKNANTGDNRIANLLCLCVKCHAEQPMHAHIRQSLRYKEFLPIWTDGLGS